MIPDPLGFTVAFVLMPFVAVVLGWIAVVYTERTAKDEPARAVEVMRGRFEDFIDTEVGAAKAEADRTGQARQVHYKASVEFQPGKPPIVVEHVAGYELDDDFFEMLDEDEPASQALAPPRPAKRA